MKRPSSIDRDTTTAPFTTAKPGHTDGDPSLGIGPTTVNADQVNAVVEGLNRAVEGAGIEVIEPVELTPDDYSQLDDAVNSLARIIGPLNVNNRIVTAGLRFTDAGLVVTTLPGEMIYEGRRYVITQEKLDDTGFDEFTLTANRDTYFFIAPADPLTPGFDKTTVEIQTTVVTIGSAIPAPPFTSVLFQRITTDGSSVTATQDFNMGILLMNDNDTGVMLRRGEGVSAIADFVPYRAGLTALVNLGVVSDPQLDDPIEGNFFNSLAVERITKRAAFNPDNPRGGIINYSEDAQTLGAAGSATSVILMTNADFTEGTVVSVLATITAFNEIDKSAHYVAYHRFQATKVGAVFVIDPGPTASPFEEHGTVALAANVQSLGLIDGGSGDLKFNLVGHDTASNTMNWRLDITLNISSHEAALP